MHNCADMQLKRSDAFPAGALLLPGIAFAPQYMRASSSGLNNIPTADTAPNLTLIVATLAGFPISTTHGLTGAMIGAGLMAAGPEVNLRGLGNGFLLPLLLSPVLAVALAATLYLVLQLSVRSTFPSQRVWTARIS
jgi:phosphate/sulfate permease